MPSAYQLDAILIPGGGLNADGTVPLWVAARLDEAVRLQNNAAYLISLSRGTPHKPNVVINGRPIYEAEAIRDYLTANGVPHQKIIIETLSLDTLTNAYYSKEIANRNGLKRLLVITSKFHNKRTMLAFQWVFGLTPADGYSLDFIETPDIGIPPDTLAARIKWEQTRFEWLTNLIERINTLDELRLFLMSPEFLNGSQIHPPPAKVLGVY